MRPVWTETVRSQSFPDLLRLSKTGFLLGRLPPGSLIVLVIVRVRINNGCVQKGYRRTRVKVGGRTDGTPTVTTVPRVTLSEVESGRTVPVVTKTSWDDYSSDEDTDDP